MHACKQCCLCKITWKHVKISSKPWDLNLKQRKWTQQEITQHRPELWALSLRSVVGNNILVCGCDSWWYICRRTPPAGTEPFSVHRRIIESNEHEQFSSWPHPLLGMTWCSRRMAVLLSFSNRSPSKYPWTDVVASATDWQTLKSKRKDPNARRP